jgi:hypothetical protein
VDRFLILNEALAARCADAEGPDQLTPEVAWLRRQLVAGGGQARVEPLMDETGWSRRLVTERFRRQGGYRPRPTGGSCGSPAPPPFFVTSSDPGWTSADLAIGCGSCDQSRFTRDFVALKGPGRIAPVLKRQKPGLHVLTLDVSDS